MSLDVLDLFSGIGGFSLGLERAGMRTVAFCEIEPYPRAILRQHWPSVPCYDDVRTLTAERLAADGIGPIDVICGGFPCQDISAAGKGAGIDGERSGLWSEYARLVGEIRPRYVIVENVAALLGRGLDRVLGDLSSLGYDAEWHCIPASAVGAPHRRDRVWIVAYAQGERFAEARADSERHSQRSASGGNALAHSDNERLEGWLREELRGCSGEWVAGTGGASLADTESEQAYREGQGRLQPFSAQRGWWLAEPDVGRVANGIPSRVDRLRALGNAVVPQIPEIIGRAIVEGLRR